MTPGEAQRWYGTRIAYNAKRADLFDKTCYAPTYERWTLSARHFESDYGVSHKRLGIPGDSIHIVRVECKDAGRVLGAELIILSPDKLLFSMDGVFFLLIRAAT